MTTSTLEDAQVRDVMSDGVIACTPDTPLRSVALTMARNRVHCLVVSDVKEIGGRPLTIVSDLDLMRALEAGVDAAVAGDVAVTEVVTIKPGEALGRAAQLMAEHEVAHLLVVDGEEPVGVLSTLDVALAVGSG